MDMLEEVFDIPKVGVIVIDTNKSPSLGSCGGDSCGHSWLVLEKYVTNLSVLLGFRVSVSSSSLSAALFFDTHVAIVLVLRRS